MHILLKYSRFLKAVKMMKKLKFQKANIYLKDKKFIFK
jgi:hypothetical protein